MLPILLAALLAPSGWGPAGCAAVVAPPVFTPPAVVHVVPAPPAPVYVRVETPEEAMARVIARRQARRSPLCGCAVCRCPAPCVCGTVPERPVVGDPPTGVDWDRVGQGYTRDGKSCSRAHVVAGITGSIVDDSAKPRLTIVGDEAFRRKALADLAALPALKDFVLTQAYEPGHWAVAQAKLGPGVWLQKADGLKIGHLASYQNADELLKLVKKADPNAPPEPKPAPSPARPHGTKHCVVLWVIAGLLAAILATIWIKEKK